MLFIAICKKNVRIVYRNYLKNNILRFAIKYYIYNINNFIFGSHEKNYMILLNIIRLHSKHFTTHVKNLKFL